MSDTPTPPDAADTATQAEAERKAAEDAAAARQAEADQKAAAAAEAVAKAEAAQKAAENAAAAAQAAVRDLEQRIEEATAKAAYAETPAEIKEYGDRAEKAIKLVIAIGLAVTILVLVGVALVHARGLKFTDDTWGSLTKSLGLLLVVSLIVERVVEAFVCIWSSRASDRLLTERDHQAKKAARRRRNIQELREELAKDPSEERKQEIFIELKEDRQEMKEAEDAVEQKEAQLVPFGARTRRLAAWSGLAVGTLASAVGLRLLEGMLDPSTPIPKLASLAKDAEPGAFQYHAFFMVDTLLTGAVLAGGSVFIHRLFTVYDSFMESTRARAKEAKDAGINS